MSYIEILLKNKMRTDCELIKKDGCYIKRVVRIGNKKNCNDDNLVYNHNIENDIKEVLEKYNITDYVLNKIHTNIEYSFELTLKEEIYENLKNNIIRD